MKIWSCMSLVSLAAPTGMDSLIRLGVKVSAGGAAMMLSWGGPQSVQL